MIELTRILYKPANQAICNVASTDTVRSTSVVRGVIYEVNKPKLRSTKQALKLRRVDDVSLKVVQLDLSPDIILELVSVPKWIVRFFHECEL